MVKERFIDSMMYWRCHHRRPSTLNCCFSRGILDVQEIGHHPEMLVKPYNNQLHFADVNVCTWTFPVCNQFVDA